MRSFSWMVTNMMKTYGNPPEELARIIDAGFKGKALEKALLECEFVQELWESYVAWVQTTAKELEYDVKISCKLEVCHDATNPSNCLLHGHIAITNTLTRFRLVNQKRMWDFMGVPAYIVTNKGRGRSAYKSIYHNNYYCQVRKIGTLKSWTNWRAFTDHPVELSFIFGLWKAYKLTSAQAQVQMRYARGRGMSGYIAEIMEDNRWRQSVREKAERIRLERTIPFKRSIYFEEIIKWVESMKQGYGKETRFPFLVLNGPSRFGKTRYATRLFGKDSTLLVTAQKQNHVDLKDFKRSQHKAIVFDEADEKYVLNHKTIFQAGLDDVTLGQSATMSYKYQVWLYGIAMIICTNVWGEAEVGEGDREWLEKNSILIQVAGPMYEVEERLPIRND